MYPGVIYMDNGGCSEHIASGRWPPLHHGRRCLVQPAARAQRGRRRRRAGRRGHRRAFRGDRHGDQQRG